MNLLNPKKDCDLCPRLCAFHAKNRVHFPSFHNAPVPSFGGLDAEILVVGLAPGLKGANQTGRPFTGDYAGIILYQALLANGLAKGNYVPPPTGGRLGGGLTCSDSVNNASLPASPLWGEVDTLELLNCRITNAVRCVPPENKPEPSEIKQCNQFLQAEIAAMPNLKVILSLGLISHNAVLRALGQKLSAAKFTHGGVHKISLSWSGLTRPSIITNKMDPRLKAEDDKVILIDSYHCSRYNINTGTLTPEMFDAVVKKVKKIV